jgi:hypothetical protein
MLNTTNCILLHLAPVRRQPQHAHGVEAMLAHEAEGDLDGRVRAAVVDDHHLVREARPLAVAPTFQVAADTDGSQSQDSHDTDRPKNPKPRAAEPPEWLQT